MQNQKTKLKDEKIYFRVKELEKYLCISAPTIWRYVRKGTITPIKISPKVVLFDIREVKEKLGIIPIEDLLNSDNENIEF